MPVPSCRMPFLNRPVPMMAAAAIFTGLGIASASSADPAISTFMLGNGMQIVVIPDRRAPVVTHMVWYKVGAADDPPGKSGLAHFFEHLMFKATKTHKSGEYSRIVSRLGGRHNALTSPDVTTYFQRVAKQHLRAVMELEADRMTNLVLQAKEVRTESDVVREERRGSVDGSPIGLMNEQMLAQLYQNHPYGHPVLGWAHEIPGYQLADVAAFYRKYYRPNNAILVVAGDVTVAEVRKLSTEVYGVLKRGPDVETSPRPSEPGALAARSLTIRDPRVGTPIMLRYYHVPSFSSAGKEDAAALLLLTRVLGGDDTSRLYRHLVLDSKIAAQAGADYKSEFRDSGRVVLLAVAARDMPPATLEAALDKIVAKVRKDGVTAEELTRAKRALEAERVFDTDNQERRARTIGRAITIGRTIEDLNSEGARIEAVTLADVQRVAKKYLRLERSVTGTILRPEKKSDKTVTATR